MTTPPPSSQPAAAPQKRLRDVFPLWAWIVLVWWALFTYANSLTPLPPGVASRMAKAAEGRVDSDALQDLIQIDLGAKTAYAISLAHVGEPANPDPKTLQDALSKSEDLERETHNSISAARRVIVMRALLGKPPFAVSKAGAPLDAFDKDLSPLLSPEDRASAVHEGNVWTAALGSNTKPRVREALAVQVRALPNIRWWGAAGTAAVYKMAHNPVEAARWNAVARSRALRPLVGVGLIGIVRAGLTFLGLALLIALMVQYFERRNNPDAGSFWKIEPPAISTEARRIGAGELAGIFLIYLLTREVITVSVGGFAGIGHTHLLQFPGAASHFQSQLARLSDQQRTSVQILVEAVVYVVSALPPLVILMAMARARGASLANEIGWNARAKGANILYGFGGYAIASPLLLLVNWLGSIVFKHLASPANPVIPQIVTASGWFVPVTLLLLASVAAPFVEEILFRGVLMNAIFIRFGAWPAIIGSGLIFGFAHPVGVGEKLTISVLGMVFAWMAQTRQSLLPSMTAHFVNNFTTTLLLLAIMGG
ncbi:hypothetical protein CCAX7_29600 [Capsulimonas corticalis]|uniref:CAAX prenyl protease 2/Lysostaphin resistance protein A-like domain-containing protein n=1 Tax=Capsulimonas corticalis TaxID=2219043 RepID=A0A402CT13_9BACT|nr:type II CAAX endopeptidase family protein [Capsulimonas corticalis]BDI30909.1 hypothetical protein CCAX7_29600 [Capsulimonas corticalis]